MGLVRGERVGGLPRLECEGDVEHVGTVERHTGQILATHHTLVHGESGARPVGNVGSQFLPGVGRRGDLGKRPGREPPGSFDDDAPCPLTGCLERQAVFDMVGDRPELKPPLDSMPASLREELQRIPITRGAPPVHLAEQLVVVTRVDESGQSCVIHRGLHLRFHEAVPRE
ncbi:MAG: hypothetical protein M5U31_09270 [Acidimicrobiia bacterium]|nr:hypothetical protein [Acidimicrobiia bacterium]